MQQDTAENFEELLAAHDAAAAKLQAGQKIKGKVITISPDSVFVDVGVKQDGVLDRAEILDADGKETVAAGDFVEAWITSVSPEGIRLSRSMTGSGAAALEEARDTGIPVEGRVTAACKGGYEVDVLGKRAFCPGSQMEINPGEPQDSAIGRSMQFLVTRVENHGRNIVVSRRALLDRQRSESLDKLLENLNIGDIAEGRISRLASYGAFVELAPAVEGLVHISELSWSRVGSPDEVVAVGEPIKVKITSIVKDDKGQTRIGLSARQAQGDPWSSAQERYKVGDVVEGVVRRLAPFGAFVELEPGVEGLAHVSELSWERRIAKPEDVLAVGDVVSVKIRELIPETRRIALSLKDAQGDPWEDITDRFAEGSKVEGTVESRSQHGIFVRLAPGITGLLPQPVISAAANANQLAKLGAGSPIEVVIKKIDPSSRRLSLGIPEATATEKEDKSWKQHTSVKPAGGNDLGIMAQALQKAFQKK